MSKSPYFQYFSAQAPNLLLHVARGRLTPRRQFMPSFTVAVYRDASFSQSKFPSHVHRGEFLVPIGRLGLIRVPDQRVIALPKAVPLLMSLHFDIYAFVAGLKHV
jgi:hypothetical protein